MLSEVCSMVQAADTQGLSVEEQRGQLISREVNNAVHSAFNALAQTVLVDNARTLEDLVREMLRPMLKSWLDDNLPTVVERLVRAEIERVSRGKD
jgi:cell pole-organizing protein PopZ